MVAAESLRAEERLTQSVALYDAKRAGIDLQATAHALPLSHTRKPQISNANARARRTFYGGAVVNLWLLLGLTAAVWLLIGVLSWRRRDRET